VCAKRPPSDTGAGAVCRINLRGGACAHAGKGPLQRQIIWLSLLPPRRPGLR
jgi:hypothetical protein